MQFKANKGKDLVTIRDFFQVVLGSSVAVISTFIILTRTSPNVTSAVSFLALLIMMIIFSVLALRPNVTPVRIAIYVVMSLTISYVLSFMVALVFETSNVGTTVDQLFSLNYFGTVSYVATLSGALGGAITDASMN